MGVDSLKGWQKFRKEYRATCIPICGICGEYIDLELPGRHPLSFSIDHIIPYSVDPSLALDPANCRPAHFSCNSSRGARMQGSSCKTTIDW